MRTLCTALSVLVAMSTVVSNAWADSTSIEFYEPTGTTITGKVGWKGDAATGEMFIETPNDGNGVTIKEGNLTANSFTGDGSGLTNLPSSTVEWSDIQNRPTGLDDGDQEGISSESDPTVPANLKDGIEWTEVSGKPSGYPPESHSHGWNEISNKPASFPPESHEHQWSELNNVPATFPPSTHSHAYGDLTGIPSSFTPSTHNHAISEVTSLQSALNAKASLSGAVFTGNVELDNDGDTLKFSDDGGTAYLVQTDIAQNSHALTYYSQHGHYFVRKVQVDGNGGVAISATNSGDKPGIVTEGLRVVGNMEAIGNITATGTCCSSDERFKRNVQPLSQCLDKVNKLQGVGYDWRQEAYPERQFAEGRQVGLIAQDVETVLPEVVSEDGDGYKAIDYGKLTAVLVEAVKEQQAYIRALEKRIEGIENAR